ncbi:ABC transporter ATP-binding protein [Sutcliffiella halmapala]
MLNIENLDFSYTQNSPVLNNVNINITSGDCVALVGYNGSGKTTIIKLILGLLKPSQGIVNVFNHSPNINNNDFKSKIGISFDDPNLIDFLTVNEYLEFVINTYKRIENGITDLHIEEYLERFKMINYKKTLIRSLSHGTKMKLQLISAMMSNPELLVLDEPTNSLDFETILNLEKTIINRNPNQTVFITSHDFDFLESVCNKFYFLYNKQVFLLNFDSNNISIKKEILSIVEDNISEGRS